MKKVETEMAEQPQPGLSITNYQLELIQKQQSELNQILSNIGYLETNKVGLLDQYQKASTELQVTKSGLEKEYGPININIATGEYTPAATAE